MGKKYQRIGKGITKNMRFGKYTLLLISIILLGEILRLIRINETMEFISDQGWFYLSAKNIIVHGQIPLVGIPSSHTWLHQGALWTYIVAIAFAVSNFNPIAPAYMTAALDAITIALLYKTGKIMFGIRYGLIAAVLYAASPLVIYNIRAPYHTSLIPLFTIILIFFLYKWVSGNKLFFPAAIGTLAILYNLEISTFVFAILVLSIIIFGIWKKQKWATGIFNKKIILYSTIAFVIPMLPMLLYDLQNGFPQTLKFITWIGYRILVIFGYPPINPTEAAAHTDILTFSIDKYKQLIFAHNEIISTAMATLSFSYLTLKFIQKKTANTFIWIINTIPLGIFLCFKTPSDAYLPMLYPGLILLTAIFIGDMLKHPRLKIIVCSMIICGIALNIHHLITNNFYPKIKPDQFTQRLITTKQIISESEGKEYNLIDKHTHPSISKNYEYLAWWLGHGPSEGKTKIQLILNEDSGYAIITKNKTKK